MPKNAKNARIWRVIEPDVSEETFPFIKELEKIHKI